ncbi:hypothetical protein AUR64_06875 [Haloprofundus marisrubri]|uniref:Uncharacterized protein n=1 Tax=Haloprofundus marisrubri TaxID=1514971 RepID=A0A0W1RBR1_9EURY|nr:hypothetical protein [Haloprofundus marisrubri]KTG10898.1 hypothetical protein AUR64_06875 [Haloprofundus marisrubri]
MDRRTFLERTAVLAAVGVAGCTSTGADGGDSGGNGNDNTGNGTDENGTEDDSGDDTTTEGDSDGSDTAIADRTFERTGECNSSGTTTVSREDDAVVVEGCIRGRNGCSVPVLDTAEYDADADRLSVVVGTEVEKEEDEMCSQALVSLGYELRVSFDGPVPTDIAVAHDGPDGQTTVTSSNASE